MAAVAEQMSIERETAAPFLVTQLHAAVLRKKTASSQQPRLPPTLRPSWESVLLSVILANAWEMVARQGGWKQKTQEALPAWTPGVAAVCRDNGTSSTSSWQFTLGKPHSKPHQQPGPGRVATRGQERLDTGHNSVLHHFHRCPVPLPNPNFPPSALNTDTDLTVVALKVIITVHRDHPHNVLTALKHVEPHGGECSIVSPKSPSHPQKPSRSNRQILQRPLCSSTQSHLALRCF